MSPRDLTLVVVGGGMAGAKAVEGARVAGHDGPVLLVGEGDAPPPELPPLSKAVLRGEADLDSTRIHPEGWYAEHDVQRVAEPAVAVDTEASRVRLVGGDDLGYGSLVLATGATPRHLTVPGADLAGVHYLRTGEDAVRLRDAIGAATRVAVVGAGWIGSEVAASARQMGADVVLIDPSPTPLHRLLGPDLGGVFASLHAEHGVTLRLGVGVDELRGNVGVEEVVLGDGRVEPADLVVAGVGVTPRVELAQTAFGVQVSNGIVVDKCLQTDVLAVFAAGDVANAYHPTYRAHLRIEHWANALNQGLVAGANAVGPLAPYDRIPFFFSDQYDLGLEYVGHHALDDAIVLRGDLAARAFIAFWQRPDGTVSAAMQVNTWGVLEDLKGVLRAPAAVDAERLADPDVPLADLVGAPATP